MEDTHKSGGGARNKTLVLSLAALGVVFGDIGTSPLYALRECFNDLHGIAPTNENLFGVLSLIVWSLVIVVTVKYLFWVMRADNQGEGGVMALIALAFPESRQKRSSSLAFVSSLGLFGAALLYGDGVITPAITVLSAVEGLEYVTPLFQPYTKFAAIIILVFLFAVQRHGTGRIGSLFGPIMMLWFAVIAGLGVFHLVKAPEILRALSPMYALNFIADDPSRAFIALASVFLVATGAEALYADMGHFGRRPIKLAWLFVALPALLLNYFGQGALLLQDWSLRSNPFFSMAPHHLILPIVTLATVAAIIASQALISGVFSLTQQAIQLGYSPRLYIQHTSESEVGQIYISHINWALMVATLITVHEFNTSSNLAGAYGIAVSLTMVITTILASVVARRFWNWSWFTVAVVLLFFLGIDLLFFAANITKLAAGGWFPILMGIVVYVLMSTWKQGRRVLAMRMRARLVDFEQYVTEIMKDPNVQTVRGTALFMNGDPNSTPPALIRNVRHNHVIHERVISLSIVSEKVPSVSHDKRVEVYKINDRAYRVRAHFGFNETPDIKLVLAACCEKHLNLKLEDITFFIGKETIIAARRTMGMPLWREKLFGIMARNAHNATSFFKIPPEQVVELGAQVEI